MQTCGASVWKMRTRTRGRGITTVWPGSSPCLVLVVLLLAIHLGTLPGASQQLCTTVCGSLQLSYPFGIEDGCGSEKFKDLLNCSKPGELELIAHSATYQVLKIDYDTSTIRINDGSKEARCDKMETHGLLFLLNTFGSGCYSVFAQFAQNKSNNCAYCEQSQGVCGYQVDNPEFETCVCNNSSTTPGCLPSATREPPPASREPPPASRISSKYKVLAAVGGAGGALFITFMCFICFRRWKTWNRNRVKGNDMRTIAHILSAGSSSASGVTMFSYKELATATRNFAEEKQLGGGGFNTVYKGKLKDGRQVAVKKLNQANRQGIQQFRAEVTILSQARHRNLVQLYGCCLEHKDPLLVYEFVANGTLADHLHGGETNLECTTRLSIAIEVAEALAYLHSLQPPIFHRDVKSTNILLDQNFIAKVGDFGLSRLSDPYRTHVSTAPQGTPGYLDPDYHQTYHLSDKSDVYSLGVVLMELITGKKAVDMSRERGEINLSAMATARIQNGTLEELLDPRLELNRGNVREVVMALGELGFQCLASEKDDRPSMREVVSKLRSIQYLALAIPSPMASPQHPQVQETRALIKTNSVNSVDWMPTETYPDFSHHLVGR